MKQNRLIYMLLGGVLALSLAFGGFAVFAQDDDGDAEPDPTTPDTETETGEETPAWPNGRRFHGRSGDLTGGDEFLAEALGITTDELDEAQQAAFAAGVALAVEEGLITQAQADEILARDFHPRGGFGRFGLSVEPGELLADALGISVEELQTAQDEAHAARLAQLVEEGVITQAQADMMAARAAVNNYFDREAVQEMIQDAYETAVSQALSDGVITQEQADALLSENNFGPFGFGGPGGRGGRRGHGPRGGFGPQNGSFAPDNGLTTENSGA